MGRATSRQQWTFSSRRRFLQAGLAGGARLRCCSTIAPIATSLHAAQAILSLSRVRVSRGDPSFTSARPACRGHICPEKVKKRKYDRRKENETFPTCRAMVVARPFLLHPPSPLLSSLLSHFTCHALSCIFAHAWNKKERDDPTFLPIIRPQASRAPLWPLIGGPNARGMVQPFSTKQATTTTTTNQTWSHVIRPLTTDCQSTELFGRPVCTCLFSLAPSALPNARRRERKKTVRPRPIEIRYRSK